MLGTEAKRSKHLWDRTLLYKHLEEGGTRLAMPKTRLRARLIVIEAWFRGYRGSPGLGGLRIAELYPLAGLLDYEDTRLKTLFCVRMGLYLAWNAS